MNTKMKMLCKFQNEGFYCGSVTLLFIYIVTQGCMQLENIMEEEF